MTEDEKEYLMQNVVLWLMAISVGVCLLIRVVLSNPITLVTLTPEPVRAISAQTEPEPAPTYVLNLHTGRFHRPGCASVARIAEWNREEVFDTREELISQGFVPCGGCNP